MKVPGAKRRHRRWAVTMTVVAVALGAGASIAVSATNKTAGTIIPPSSCGQDASYKHTASDTKAISRLRKNTQQAYKVWPFDVKRTPWEAFKGKKPPWKIGYIEFPLVNSWQVNGLAQTRKMFAAAKKKGLVEGKLITHIQQSFATATPEQQIAAIQQMVRQGVDGILLHPLNEAAMAPAVDAAGKAGVPIVMELGIMPKSKYIVNFAAHNFAFGPTLQKLGVMGLANKPINAMYVRGVTSVTEEQVWYNEGVAALKACKNITLLGEVVGAWNLATVKTEVLKFLASHPQTIDVVFQNGSMDAGVIQAFEQAGRPVPLIAMNNVGAGGLSWWNENKAKYQTAGTTINGAQAHNGAFRVLLRILGGKGLKVRDVHVPAPTVTNSNLRLFLLPGADINTDKESNAPLNFWSSNPQLDGYFTKTGTPGGL